MKKNQFRRRFAAAGASLAVVVGLGVSAAAPAEAWSTGFFADGLVTCRGSYVVGVWVNAGSGSGWASYNYSGGGYYSYSKSLGWGHPTYSLAVGCGGSSARWGSSNYTGTLIGDGGLTNYFVSCGNGSCTAVGVE